MTADIVDIFSPSQAHAESNGTSVRRFLKKHASDIAAVASVGVAGVAVVKTVQAAQLGRPVKAIATGLYAGYATIGAGLNVASAVVGRTSDDPGNHPITRARNAWLFGSRNGLQRNSPDAPDAVVRSINHLQRKPSLVAR